jgi:hypothetical protein
LRKHAAQGASLDALYWMLVPVVLSNRDLLGGREGAPNWCLKVN